PIRAQTLQTQLDQASLKTPRQLGSAAVAMAAEVGTHYVRGGALRRGGQGAKAAARSEAGRGTAKAAEEARKKRVPVARGACSGYSTACANVDKYVLGTGKFSPPDGWVTQQESKRIVREGVERKQNDDFKVLQFPDGE